MSEILRCPEVEVRVEFVNDRLVPHHCEKAYRECEETDQRENSVL